MVAVGGELPILPEGMRQGRRLVSSRFPPIALFDDVASAADFEAIYRLQALTNPRLESEVGNLSLIPREEIPFGIVGCAYATAPFTHVNPDGSRFSNGDYGVLYVADTIETALAEVGHHQQCYWGNVQGLHYDRLLFRALRVSFAEAGCADACELGREHAIYATDDYQASQALGAALKGQARQGVRYHSVRADEALCWGLLTPSVVTEVIQTSHYEMIWSGESISSINRVESLA